LLSNLYNLETEVEFWARNSHGYTN
jgi:hypothetical protein